MGNRPAAQPTAGPRNKVSAPVEGDALHVADRQAPDFHSPDTIVNENSIVSRDGDPPVVRANVGAGEIVPGFDTNRDRPALATVGNLKKPCLRWGCAIRKQAIVGSKMQGVFAETLRARE